MVTLAFAMVEKNRIAHIRQLRRWSQEQLAERAGTTGQQIGRLEAGTRKLTVEWMNRLAAALGVKPTDILASEAQHVVPLVGYIGAGAEVLSIDDHAKGGGLEEVEAPPMSSPSTVAVRVRGNSMYPAYSDGDTLYYDRRDDGDLRHLIGRECVVKLADGRCFIKILQLGTQPGLWTLLSTNAPPMIDQSVEWAARVKWVLKA